MLEEKIYKEYVDALKSKDKHKRAFLSLIRAEFKNYAINSKKEKLDDNEILIVLKKQQKRLFDAKDSITASARKDLIHDLERELAIINAYRPKPLNDEELIKVINETIKETNASSVKDMGLVIKEVLRKVGIKGDARKISIFVKDKLSS